MSSVAWTLRGWIPDDADLERLLVGLLEDTGWWLGLLAAAAIGALHAIGPGHGKALIGAYLAGSRGRPRDAVALGGLVAIMHTASVLVVALLFYGAQSMPGGDRMQDGLRIVSAVAITTVGVWMLVRELRRRRAPRRAPAAVPVVESLESGMAVDEAVSDHAQDDRVGHDGHNHHHDLPDGVAPMSRAGIVALATSGGLLPSPAAFLVLATSLALGRATYGLALVAAFGVGLAVTLAAVGLAVLWGRARLARRGGTRVSTALHGVLPLAAALAVIVGGLWFGVAAALRL